jgi:RHS repeat-associated protein
MFSVSSQKRNTKDVHDWQSRGRGFESRLLHGSVDLVTDRNGVAYEFFLYTPWGEDMYSYNAGASSFTSPYRFNGKEKDPETGYSYYGARYYQSKFSVWMSVDPLAHETLEPYVFTGNNAIMLVDPDGRKIDLSGLTSEQVEAYNSIIEDFRSKSDMFDKIYSELESTEKETFYVKTFSSLDEKIRKENNADGAYSSSTNTAYIDLNNGETYINELIHAFQDNLNVYDNDDLTFKEGEGDIIHALISTQLYPDGVVGTAFGMGNLIIDLVESDYSITDEMMITEQVNAIAKNRQQTYIELIKENPTLKLPKSYTREVMYNRPHALLNLLK